MYMNQDYGYFDKTYMLDAWQEEHESDEEGYYTCPECGYALDFIQDGDGINYVYCWNECFEVYK